MKIFKRAYWNLLYITFIYISTSFEEMAQVRWMSHFIECYTLILFLIPLCIKLKRAQSWNLDFLISLKLPNQHLVSWTNEHCSGWLQINDIFLKISQVLLKFVPVKRKKKKKRNYLVKKKWNLFFLTFYSTPGCFSLNILRIRKNSSEKTERK